MRAGDATFTALRDLRDAVGRGSDLESPDYQEILRRYQAVLKGLRNILRADLGSPPLHDEVTF